ncbi:DUF4159 domain-containing protein [Gluconacetobacter entanii]|uniref:DUF4159 domain-containing protein n=1 Tax=Gluconacetobacter entanii TaxID=108528 RepID=A0ABT3K686_9PROT|nr:DUF4159 domain-containing protein [Gluconacetobacter entanii]MCW4590927.1 DUF4159 domain-containing protein [Gluconacetobacter entanii]MCW4594420.1 DUF4159 domain-containing protein [Gluconacetobacter entanii]NPC90037.1 DUF4159 domain-containing protein [Gluconacetobacter entanii]
MILTAPWVLWAFVLLPVVWLLLRALPPRPREQAFPPIAILRGLGARNDDVARAPPWLLVLRCLAVALVIAACAQPFITRERAGITTSADTLLVIDNGWAAAPGWTQRLRAVDSILQRLSRNGHAVRLLLTAPPAGDEPVRVSGPQDPAILRTTLDPTEAQPWGVDRHAATSALQALVQGGWHGPVLYLADGLATPDDAAFAAALRAVGPVRDLRLPDADIVTLAPGHNGSEALDLRLRTVPRPVLRELALRAQTIDNSTLQVVHVTLPPDARQADVRLNLPVELRNQLDHVDVDAISGPASVRLLDENDRRRPVGLISGNASDTPLMGSLFYLRRALAPGAELREGSLDSLLSRPLSILIAPDGTLGSPDARHKVEEWVRKGGTLIRFAGPLLVQAAGGPGLANPTSPPPSADAPGANVPGTNAPAADALLPVQLMDGERVLGGAMSWSKPEHLAPFDAQSPFHDLPVPGDVTVSKQVLARPSTDLDTHTWARLTDGTPLVTHAALGAGQVVLFHVTSTADWSNLPLSGLFVSMLQRLGERAVGIETPADQSLLSPYLTLDGAGVEGPPPAGAQAVRADAFGHIAVSAIHPPGLYGPRASRRALNVGDEAGEMLPQNATGTMMDLRGQAPDIALGPILAVLGLALILVDGVVAILLRSGGGRKAGWISGRMTFLALVMAGAALASPAGAETRDYPDEPRVIVDHPDASSSVPGAALETRLGYIVTNHEDIDTVSREGLQGLSDYVNARTSAVLGHPDALVPERDDLSYYPMIYWPVTADATTTPARTAALNAYMRHGGILMIDTQGQDPATAQGGSDNSFTGSAPGTAAALRRMTAGLDIPPLMKLDDHHVLTHTFYLLHDFPGRYDGMPVWVAQEGDSTNDGVSPVIIGSNDWAHAWAVDDSGNTPYATIPDGAEQRTLAYRFGVNAVLYALTGNYKADQVHVPALLKRLGE